MNSTDTYLRWVVDDELDELLPALPAIALECPKAVGKTETARRRARTVFRLDDPAQAAIASADPSQLLTVEKPVFLDEWQLVTNLRTELSELQEIDAGIEGRVVKR